MARLLGVKQCLVFAEEGDAKITTEFGENIHDYPTPGKIGNHNGLDMVRCTDGKTSELAHICAIADGTIYAQRKWVKGFDKIYSGGNCVYILHDDGVTISKYMHMKYGTVSDWVCDGARVSKGDILGYMGSTGLSYGDHLHLQIEKLDTPPETITPSIKGTPVDPEPYLLGEIVIGKKPEYYVKIGMFEDLEDAIDMQDSLRVLGTDSIIVEVE